MIGNNEQEGGRTLYTDKEYEKAQEWCDKIISLEEKYKTELDETRHDAGKMAAIAKLFYDESDRFRFEIGTGVFVPGDAWTNRAKSGYPILPSQSVYESSTSDDYDPEVAWNVIANLYFMF